MRLKVPRNFLLDPKMEQKEKEPKKDYGIIQKKLNELRDTKARDLRDTKAREENRKRYCFNELLNYLVDNFHNCYISEDEYGLITMTYESFKRRSNLIIDMDNNQLKELEEILPTYLKKIDETFPSKCILDYKRIPEYEKMIMSKYLDGYTYYLSISFRLE
jgi:hypothetical protein